MEHLHLTETDLEQLLAQFLFGETALDVLAELGLVEDILRHAEGLLYVLVLEGGHLDLPAHGGVVLAVAFQLANGFPEVEVRILVHIEHTTAAQGLVGGLQRRAYVEEVVQEGIGGHHIVLLRLWFEGAGVVGVQFDLGRAAKVHAVQHGLRYIHAGDRGGVLFGQVDDEARATA